MTPNLPASVRQRLRNLARDQGVDYNRLQLLYLQERWLARLARTVYRDNLVLKGGLYLYGHYGLASRPTRDIDFLGRSTPASVPHIVRIVTTIATTDLSDGVSFDPASITTEENRTATEYGGIRVELTGYLGTARERLRIDVGFGDALPAGALPLEYPTLLGAESPSLLAYSFETVIAEKLQAATVLLEVNSRFKDFYDVHELAATRAFDAEPLRQALDATFTRRGTHLPDAQRLFDPDFTEDRSRQTQWNAFLKRIGTQPGPTFARVMTDLHLFLGPILSERDAHTWRPTTWSWTSY